MTVIRLEPYISVQARVAMNWIEKQSAKAALKQVKIPLLIQVRDNSTG